MAGVVVRGVGGVPGGDQVPAEVGCGDVLRVDRGRVRRVLARGGGAVPGGDEGPPEPFRRQLARRRGFPGAGVRVPERLERLVAQFLSEAGGDGLQGDGGLHEFARFLCLLQCPRRRGREGFVEPRLNADRGEVHTGVALGDWAGS